MRDLTPLEPPDQADAEQEFAENFASRGARRHASVLPGIIDDFRPDVVVRDEADLGAAVAAEGRGLPSAIVLVLAAGTLIRPDLVLPRLSAVRSEHGLSADADPARPPELVLSPFPPSLRASRALPARVDLSYRTRPPVVRRKRGTPPAVYLTLGTVFGMSSGDLLERLLAGLAQVPARVTVAVGRHIDPAVFGPQPDHVTVERYVDQEAVISRSDLVVHHGGSGTMLAGLAHGLPQLLTPLGADQTHNAERAEALGFGRVVDAATAAPADIREAVELALADRSLGDQARRLQQEIDGLPEVDATVPLLERLV